MHHEGWLFSFVWEELISHRNCFLENSEVMEKKPDPIGFLTWDQGFEAFFSSTFDSRLAAALSAQILGIDQLWVTYGNLQKMKASPEKTQRNIDVSHHKKE